MKIGTGAASKFGINTSYATDVLETDADSLGETPKFDPETGGQVLPEVTVVGYTKKKIPQLDPIAPPSVLKNPTLGHGDNSYQETPVEEEPPRIRTKDINFDNRLLTYLSSLGQASSTSPMAVIDPFNKNQGSSVFVNTLIGDKDDKEGTVMKEQYAKLKDDPRVYGTPAIMNPYATIRLYGASEVMQRENGRGMYISENYAIDRQRYRKFYDVTTNDGSDPSCSLVSSPTTSNIIRWGAQDPWGRTPFRFQDFVFCKHWNVIENNRLMVLRRYPIPTQDNLTFEGMYGSSDKDINKKTFSPMCTMVTYFGGDSGNKLSSLLAFSCGYTWKEFKSEMFKVTISDKGSGGDRQGAFDSGFSKLTGTSSSLGSMLDGLTFGFQQGSGASPFASLFGTIMQLFLGKGEGTNDKALYDNDSYPDPYEKGPWMNKIQGPINSIDSVKGRDMGLKFRQSGLKVKFSYVARPVGGINTKAVMLDILANALAMGYSSGVFWKGAHRFNIKPTLFYAGDTPFGKFRQCLAEGKVNEAVNVLVKLLKNVFKMDKLSGLFDSIRGGAQDFMEGALNSLKESFSQDEINQAGVDASGEEIQSLNQFGKDGETITDETRQNFDKEVGGMIKGMGKLGASFVSGLIKYLINMSGTIKYLSNYGALLNGDPVGDWHLTVGNPFNPVVTIGNLICTDMQVNFSDELGPDDFPLEMNVTYTLEHGMARDSDAIQSMFNRGVGRIYTLPDWAKTSADFMTKVDKNINNRDDGTTHKGYDQDVVQKDLSMIYDYTNPEMNKVNQGTAGREGGDVHQQVKPVSANTEVMNIPKYAPINPSQSPSLELNMSDPSDLAIANRGIFYVESMSQYASLVHNG